MACRQTASYGLITPSRKSLPTRRRKLVSFVDRFPFRVADIDHCPGRFRDSLREAVDVTDNISQIIYSPAFAAGKASLPGSVLCVTDRHWVIVHETRRDGVVVEKAEFAETLFVEVTVILLYGQLKIDYVLGDHCRSGICYFNAVMEGFYTSAIEQVLNSIDGIWHPSGERDKKILQDLKDWPLKFRNFGWGYLPAGSKLLNTIYWPTVFGRFGREFASAGAIFLTDRHLVVIAEERSRSWFEKRDRTRYGATITYLPRTRISGFKIQERRRFRVLELEAHAAHGTKKFQVFFPTECQEEVSRLLRQAF
jgi:hypothetical protein